MSFAVYCIENLLCNKKYIGHTCNFHNRKREHFSLLRKNKHHSRHLQFAYNKDGLQNFIIKILVGNITNVHDAIVLEQKFMDAFRVCDPEFGYNMNPTARSCYGRKLSEETKAKIGRSNKGKQRPPQSQEVIQRRAEKMRGSKRSEDTRKRMCIAQKGKVITEEARIKITQALTGKKQSLETVTKRIAKTKGLKRSSTQIHNIKVAGINNGITKLYIAFGKEQSINDWAKEYGINVSTLRNRVERGKLPLDVALIQQQHRGKKIFSEYREEDEKL